MLGVACCSSRSVGDPSTSVHSSKPMHTDEATMTRMMRLSNVTPGASLASTTARAHVRTAESSGRQKHVSTGL